MSGFTDRFGGEAIQPSDVGYRAVNLVADSATYWPEYATNNNVLASIMEVTASVGPFKMELPDATLASPGHQLFFKNVGVNNFLVTNSDGITLYTVSPGQIIFFYLQDASTAAGSWSVNMLGVGTGTLDLLTAAGPGLTVALSSLAVSPATSSISSSRTMAATDRAVSYLWTGGTGTLTLPLSASLQPFYFEIRNQGTGALTLATTGGELVDGSSTIVLQPSESCFVHSGAAAWFTVGRGRNSQFNFTQLQQTVTGGTLTETLTQAANVVQTFTGVLTSNQDVVFPPIVQVYYVANSTSGLFNLRFKTAVSGLTVSIPTGQTAVLFCDGTNVVNASTTTAGANAVLLGSGSAGSPSLGVGATNTGIFSNATNVLSISVNSTKVADFHSGGLSVSAGANGAISINSPSGVASLIIQRTAGNYGQIVWYTGASTRWVMGANATSETGANAGSDFALIRYTDAGAAIDAPVFVSRATGQVTIQNNLIVGTTFNCGGSAGIGGVLSVAGDIATSNGAITAQTSNSTGALIVKDFGTQGANIKLSGPSGNKYIRALNNKLEYVNNGYSAVIAGLNDTGTFFASQGYGCQAGQFAGQQINCFNFFWNAGGGSILAYIDATFIGTIQMVSDERAKQAIQPLASDREAFLRIQPVSYRFKDHGIFADDGVDKWGFSAQNLAATIPKAIIGDVTAVDEKGAPVLAAVDERPILAVTVLEVQKLIREVAELRAELAALKGV